MEARWPSFLEKTVSMKWSERDQVITSMKRYVGAVFVFSVLYWLWALYNILEYHSKGGVFAINKFDYGVFTFFFAGASCVVFFVTYIPQYQNGSSLPSLAHVWFPLPQLFVSANYLTYVFAETLQWRKFLYYSTFGVGWFLASIFSYYLVNKWTSLFQQARVSLVADHGAEQNYVSIAD